MVTGVGHSTKLQYNMYQFWEEVQLIKKMGTRYNYIDMGSGSSNLA
jgi:hypothetical protein